jgi:predicted RNase H-like HicB family nuclease
MGSHIEIKIDVMLEALKNHKEIMLMYNKRLDDIVHDMDNICTELKSIDDRMDNIKQVCEATMKVQNEIIKRFDEEFKHKYKNENIGKLRDELILDIQKVNAGRNKNR